MRPSTKHALISACVSLTMLALLIYLDRREYGNAATSAIFISWLGSGLYAGLAGLYSITNKEGW